MISSLWHLGNYWPVNEHLVSKIDVFEAGKMGQLDKSQTVTDDWIQSVSTTAALLGPSQSAVVRIDQKRSMKPSVSSS